MAAVAAAAAEPAGPAGPTLKQINKAIHTGKHEALAQLLAQGPRPEVPLWDDNYGMEEAICFSYDGSQESDFYEARGLQDPLYTLLLSGGRQDNRVAMCEALLAAGFRPTVYPDVGFEARAPDDGEFIDRMHLKDLDIVFGWGRPEVVKEVATFQRGVPLPVAKPQLGGANRLLAMLIKGETWSPADHKHYPPAFRAAVRTLLLAHRRSGSAAAGGGSKGSSARRAAAESEFCALSQLEPECLLSVVRHLAQPPLAPWLFKQPWGAVRTPDRKVQYARLRALLKRLGYGPNYYSD